MKLILSLLLFYLNINLFAAELPFSFERINPELNGCAFNKSSIILYGTGSIIMRSSDRGRTWSQKAIADDSLAILKIKEDNGNYYGILDKNVIIKSTNDGLDWQVKPVDLSEDILDMDITSNRIFILKKASIAIFDFNLDEISSIEIDTVYKSKEIIFIKNKIYLASANGRIITIDLDNDNKKQIIDFGEMNLCSNCQNVTRIKFENNIIYAAIRTNVFKSEDMGNSWSSIGENFNIYHVHNNTIYDTKMWTNDNNLPSSIILLYEVKDKKWQRLTNDSMQRFAYNLIVKDYYFFDNATILAIGQNKLISISTNSGKTWNLISVRLTYFKNWINEKIGYSKCLAGQFFRTTDGGITSIPQFYTDTIMRKFKDMDLLYMDSNGKGFFFTYSKVNGVNFFCTNDFGDTFKAKSLKEVYGSRGLHGFYNPSVYKVDSVYHLFCTGQINSNCYSQLFILDTNFNFIRKTVTDSLQIVNVIPYKNRNEFLALGIEEHVFKHNTFGDSTITYLLYSNNSGISWTKLFMLNINDTLIGKLNLIGDKIFASGQYFVRLDSSVYFLSEIDIKKQTFKILIKDSTNSQVFDNIFKFGNSVYKGGRRFLYYNDDIDINPVNWKKLSFRNLMCRDITWCEKDKAYFYGDNFDKHFAVEYKLFLKKPANIENKIEKNYNKSIYSYPPYPQPAHNIVNSLIYWDMACDIQDADISVFNILGEKIEGKENINIEIITPYSGRLSWYCAKVRSGIYFINIKHANADNLISIIIDK